VAEVVRPSPARADAPDETSWLPLPVPDALPTVEDLLTAPATDDTANREIPVSQPSPARAEPHDETSWLPLPEIEDLPAIADLLPADGDLAMPVAREAPTVTPSPARAEPHDEMSWLPLPEVEDLPDITELVDPDRATGTPAATPTAPRPRRHLRTGFARRRLLALALVVATIGAGFYAFPRIFNNGDHVQLQVDGRLVSAQSGVSTVGSFLKEQKVKLGPDDQVVPEASTGLSDGLTVQVLRAFAVTVDLDGTQRVVHTARSLPHDFLATLHLPATVGVRQIPARLQDGSLIQLRTHRKGTLNVDGRAVKYDQPVYTVSELLDDYKVILGPQDFTSPAANQPVPVDNPLVTVVRVAQNLQSQNQPYNVPDQNQPDPNLLVGQTRVQAGTTGTKQVTYQITTNNGAQVNGTPVSEIPIVPAQPTIHYFGTKADQRWQAIANCETGGNWSIVAPTYSGGLGIYNGTWNAFGGQQFASNPGLATREQQIIVAERIRAKYGFSAWGCGKTLGLG
jgi:resuscitation-promoting factor RpfB